MRASTCGWALLCLLLVTSVWAAEEKRDEPKRHVSKERGFSVSVPKDWVVEDKAGEPLLMQEKVANSQQMVSINIAQAKGFKTAEEYAAQIQRALADQFNIHSSQAKKEAIDLPIGRAAKYVLIQNDSQAEIVYYMLDAANARIFVITCRAGEDWQSVEARYDWVAKSIRLEK